MSKQNFIAAGLLAEVCIIDLVCIACCIYAITAL